VLSFNVDEAIYSPEFGGGGGNAAGGGIFDGCNGHFCGVYFLKVTSMGGFVPLLPEKSSA